MKPHGKILLVRPTYLWKNIKIDFKEIGCEELDSSASRLGTMSISCGQGNEFRFHESMDFLTSLVTINLSRNVLNLNCDTM